ncbi:MAG TPA: hypothetical protein VIC33_03255 [Vicinamibacterales bacterium]|jgi:hypothetical protein
MEELNPSIRIIIAWFAGALAIVVFREPVLEFLHVVHLTVRTGYSTVPTAPMAVPQVASDMFWAAVWAMGLAFLTVKRPTGATMFRNSIIYGAVALSIVQWVFIAMAKQLPLFDGGHPGEIITTLLSNGAWGFGTALFLLVFSFATVKLSPLSLT